MNHLKGLCSLFVLAGLVMMGPGTALADPAKEAFCDGIKDMDKQNWCRAFKIDEANFSELSQKYKALAQRRTKPFLIQFLDGCK